MSSQTDHPAPFFTPAMPTLFLNTMHRRHTLILLLQLAHGFPSQMVPLINQQRCPASNSQAGQFLRLSGGHAWTSQQGWIPFVFPLCKASRKSICLSIYTGTFRHPCSKLWIALRDVPKSSDNFFWVLPSRWREAWNSSLFIGISRYVNKTFQLLCYNVV
jgi:hypothetical protein